jgi:hypothetical protein
MTDPRRAGDLLHRAAEVLRWTAAAEARGPWRWADPDPEAGAAERLDRPTSPKDMPAFPARHAAPPDPGALLPGELDLTDEAGWPGRRVVPDPLAGDPPARPGVHGVPPVGPAVATPLAELLDALARHLPVAVDAGGSLDDEPFRSALRLATAIVDGAGSAGGG